MRNFPFVGRSIFPRRDARRFVSSRQMLLGLSLIVCCSAFVGCKGMFSGSAFSAQSLTPSSWDLFGAKPLPPDRESERPTALEADRLRHLLTSTAWQFEPLRLATRTNPPTELRREFVGRLSGVSVDTPIMHAALVDQLADEDVKLSTGAAILLAQRNDDSGRKLLTQAVTKTDLPLPQRCAAAEALGALGQDQELLVKQLLAIQAEAAERAKTYDPKWHAAVILAASASTHPSMDPRLLAIYEPVAELPAATENPTTGVAEPALLPECQSPHPIVRAAVLLAWRGKGLALPPLARELRNDLNPQLRALYCRIASLGDPAAEIETAVDALQDGELSVRFAAVELLGAMPREATAAAVAVGQLRQTLDEKGDLLQAAAVESLARLGAWDDLRRASRHASWHVRQSVARQYALPGAPFDEATWERLLTDGNVAVQEAAVSALAALPLKESGPLLLLAIERSSRVAGTNAENILALKWPAARALRETSVRTQERAAQLKALGMQLTQETAQTVGELQANAKDAFGESLRNAVQGARELEGQARSQFNGAKQSASAFISDAELQAEALKETARDRVAAVKRAYDSGAVQNAALEQLSPELREAAKVLLSPDAPQIARDAAITLAAANAEAFSRNLDALLNAAEANVGQQLAMLPDRIYLDVLPQHQPAFAALQKLAVATDPAARQMALAQLQELTVEDELSPAAVDRLVQLVSAQQDPALWRSALNVIHASPRESARHLARLALSNNDSEVVRLACEYFAAQGDDESARLLGDYLDHASSTVAIAAANGLARCRTLPDVARLEQLLIAPDRRLRVAAATTLAHHEVASGSDALVRLVRDADPQIRRDAAAAMGALRRIEYLPVLLELLDESNSLQRVALISLERIATAYHTGPEITTTDPAAIAVTWRAWYQTHATELVGLPPSAEEAPADPGTSMHK